MDKDNQLYTMTLTGKQMLLIADCIEDCARFLTGQCGLDNLASGLDNQQEIQDRLRNLHDLVATGLAGNPNAYYGWTGGWCPNEGQHVRIARLYSIFREIRNFMAYDDGYDISETSDAEVFPLSEDLLPLIKIKRQ